MSSINLITGDGECLTREKFTSWLNKLGFGGNEYNVISVLGSQSSGKSTLLNSTFGLDFDTMNTKSGHSQTTRGIWAGLGKFKRDFLVFDVEGTDSFERGDSHLTFEHQTTLFSLALADCLFVNIWYHGLGNRIGSNYVLLRTVFEANFEITIPERTTDIVFLIRDWCEELAPLDVIKNKIINYMDTIWSEIKHPEGTMWTKYYRVRIFGISNAILSKEAFKEDCCKLLDMLQNEICLVAKDIPSDGLPAYVLSIWNTIKQQAHLDIPTQQEMLATLRCHEFKNLVLVDVDRRIDDAIVYLNANDGNLIDGHLYSDWKELVKQDAVKSYIEQTIRYDGKISEMIKLELLDVIEQKMSSVSLVICNKCIKRECEIFTRKVDDAFSPGSNPTSDSFTIGGKSPKIAWSTFNITLEQFENEALENYKTETCHGDPEPLIRQIGEISQRVRDSNRNLLEQVMVHYIISTFDLDGIFLGILTNLRETMDDAIDKAVNDAKEEFNQCINQFDIELQGMGNQALEFLLNRISLSDVVYKRFERYFEIGDNFVPREWTSLSQVENCFIKAKEEAFALIKALRVNKFLKITDAKETQVIRVAMEKMQISCKRAQGIVANSKSGWRSVPFGFWVLLLVLGWNEIFGLISLVFNPKIFFTFILIISVYFSIAWRGKSLMQVYQEYASMVFTITSYFTRIINELTNKK